MDRPLLKLYLIIALGLCAAVLFAPSIVVRTSVFVSNATTHAMLYAYRFRQADTAAAEGNGKAKAIIIMDDGWETQYTRGYQILSQNGYKACVAVIPAAVGTPGYMDYSQLADLYTHGWDLLNHTYNHANLANLQRDEQADQVNRARDWFRSHLLDRGSNIVVYPGTEHTGALDKMLQEEGYVAASSLRSLWIANEYGTPEDVEICNMTGSMPFTRVSEAIDRAIRNKGTVILVLHKIEPVCENTQMQIEEQFFKDTVDYLCAHSDALEVVTLTEFLSLRAAQRAGYEQLSAAGNVYYDAHTFSRRMR